MLAKLGLTSPFNKRKIKELNSSKQLLHQQQQQTQLQAPQVHISSIPTPKRFSNSSNLPVYQTALKPNSLVHASESACSGISNKTLKSSNSSRSTSPANISLAESTLNGSSASASQMSKGNTTKLPQFQMSSNSNSNISKIKPVTKTALPKATSQKPQPTPSNVQSPNQIQQNLSTPSASKIQQSKLLAPSSYSDKTVKRLAPLVNQAQALSNSSQMPVLVNPPVVTLNNNSSAKPGLTLSQSQAKKTTLTFGLPKLTKLNSIEQTTQNNESKPSLPGPQLTTSKIPGTQIANNLKSQLKSPSIQINTQLKPPTQIPKTQILSPNKSLPKPPLTPLKKQTGLIPPSPLKTFQTNSASNLTPTMPSKQSRKEENSKLDKTTSKQIENEEDDEKELGILDDEIENLIDDNDEEFQKFLNDPDDDDHQIQTTCAQSQLEECQLNKKEEYENLQKISEKSSSTTSSSSISPPLPSPPCLTQPAQNLLDLPAPPVLQMPTSSHLLLAATEKSNCLNLNSFGRSNTLDRKLKPLQQINITSSQQQQQRNSLSLSIQLKSPLNYANSKRPVSQDTILENSNEDKVGQLVNNITPLNCPPTGTLSKIQHLNYELESAKTRVATLSNQLNSSSQVIYTLEQSIANLSNKIQALSANCHKKDSIINDLKNYLDYFQNKYPKIFEAEKNQLPRCFYSLTRQNSNESLNSLNSMFSQRSYQSSIATNQTDSNQDGKAKKRSWLRNSFNRAFNRKNCNRKNEDCNSIYAEKSCADKKLCLSDVEENDFLNKSSNFDSNGTNGFPGEFSLPSSPLHQQIINNQLKRNSSLVNQIPATLLSINQPSTQEELEEFQRLLRDKEIKLTDCRLEALATAHQLDQTKEENLKMKIEIEQLKSENIRMQQILSTYHSTQQTHAPQHHNTSSLVSSPSPSASVISSSSNNSKMNLSLSNSSHNVDNLIINQSSSSASSTSSSVSCSLLKSPLANGVLLNDTNINEGKRVIVTIYLGNLENPLEEIINDDKFNFINQILIGSICLTTKTKWDILDGMIKRLFSEYLNKLDCNSIESGGLGLGLESIHFYLVGDMLRKDGDLKIPDLLPYGYLVGNHSNIVIKLKDACLNCIDSLCYDTLVPKNVMQRYISLIMDYKNLLFCGPSGTSKSYIARKIGEYLVKRLDKELEHSIAYYDVENKTIRELKQYLNSFSEEIPIVLIIDNLHSISNISEAFMDYFSSNRIQKCSYIIGTINQSNVTALNLHQNFKWVLCVNHTEPVKNFLTRYLERRLIDQETRLNSQCKLNDFEQLIEWIPKLWMNINKYIELYNSIDSCIGPKIFSTFPMDFKQALDWFVNLWNGTIVPFLTDTIKEGVQVYGGKISWEDPKQWLAQTLPWLLYDNTVLSRLESIQAYQVGYEGQQFIKENFEDYEVNNRIKLSSFSSYTSAQTKISRSSHENDKLLNMLMKLQEATGLNAPIHGLETSTNDLMQNVKNLSLLTSGSNNCQNALESQL